VGIIFIVIIQIKFKNIKLETHVIDIILYNKAELQGCKKFAVILTSRFTENFHYERNSTPILKAFQFKTAILIFTKSKKQLLQYL
jgi:hypothetical protein